MIESNPGQDFNPRTHEGYDLLQQQIDKNDNNFNPRTRERYDHDFLQMKSYPLIALIPVPMKGTTSFITREIINDMF